jgi:hypothetical protein
MTGATSGIFMQLGLINFYILAMGVADVVEILCELEHSND